MLSKMRSNKNAHSSLVGEADPEDRVTGIGPRSGKEERSRSRCPQPLPITGGGTEPDGIEDNPLTWAWGLAPAPSSAVDITLDLEPGTVPRAGLCC